MSILANRVTARRRLLLVAALVLGCCARPADDGPRRQAAVTATGSQLERPAPSHAQVSPPFDVGTVIRRVRYRFRRGARGALVGGSSTHAVRVAPGGAFAVTPYRYRGAGRGARPVAGRPLQVETAAIERGSRSLLQRRPAVRLRGSGAVAIERGPGVVEQLRNRSDGVEQSWRFAQLPRGEGALRLRLRATGQRFSGASAGGLHFRDDSAGVGLRYSTATWIDARGQRVAVTPRVAAGEIVLEVPAEVLAASRFPAVLDPTLSSEISMDQPSYGPALTAQEAPAIARGGDHYLVVWQDQRPGGWNIFGARVHATDGTIEEPDGIPICTAEDEQTNPEVIYDLVTGNFFVVWEDKRFGSVDIYGARVAANNGAVLDADGFPICDDAAEQGQPAVALDDQSGKYFVVWADRRDGDWDIFGARVDTATTTVEETDGIQITGAPTVGDQQRPTVAFDGTRYLVAWEDERHDNWDIYGARVSVDGTVQEVGAQQLQLALIDDDQRSPRLIYDNSNFFLVWEDRRTGDLGSVWDIYGERINPATGQVLASDDRGFAICTADEDQTAPRVAFDGSNYLVVWQDARKSGQSPPLRGIYAARVQSSDAVVLDVDGFVVSEQSEVTHAPAVAYDAANGRFKVVWHEQRHDGTGSDIFAADVTGTAVANEVAVAQTQNDEERPAVASDGSDYLVVWSDLRNAASTGWDIYGVRVKADGTVPAQDAAGVPIYQGDGAQSYPTVAYDSANDRYLVVWQDARDGNWDLYGARVVTSGATVSAEAEFAIATEETDEAHPGVAFDGSNFFAVWAQDTGVDADIYGAVISPAGSVGTAQLIDGAVREQNYPHVAHDGVNPFIVVYQDKRNGAGWDVYGKRVDASGAPIDTTALEITIGTNDQEYPQVACDGSTRCLVAWQDKWKVTHTEIYGNFINAADGSRSHVGLGLPIAVAANDQLWPGVAYAGSSVDFFVVVWTDRRAGGGDELYATRVSHPEGVADPDGVVIASGSSDRNWPRMARGADGELLIAFYYFHPNLPYDISRVRARLMTQSPDGETCEHRFDCLSGFCVDGRCCEEACGDGDESDCRACSVEANGTDNGKCTAATAAHTCRAAENLCDLAESCDGVALECPSDARRATGEVCRAAAGLCDEAETCDASDPPQCPADAMLIQGTKCRAAAGVCDVGEVCDGVSADCPPDLLVAPGTECRAVAGDCDVAEACDGTSPHCPEDIFSASSVVCRPLAQQGGCDVDDYCTGTGPDCPADEKLPDETLCNGGHCMAGECVPLPDLGPDLGPDAGVEPDATVTPDVGAKVDTKKKTDPDYCPPGMYCGADESGCGCTVDAEGGGDGLWVALALVGLALLRRRRW